ncbi:MAG: hypothetical protein GX259_07720 [Bacteroidales bacterium]|nr:hypothetical protein [Bacteroidales bacterium]
MTFSIETISVKNFLLISLIFAPLVVVLPLLCNIYFNSDKFIILIPFLFITIILIAKKYSKQKSKLEINNERLIINDKSVDFSSIIGYHLNYSAILISSIDLRLKSRDTISITSLNFGTHGKEFKRLTDYLIRTIEENNKNVKQLNYQDVHIKQKIFLRPIIIVGIILILSIDIFAIYLKVIGAKELPWQIFFINILIIPLIPYLKRIKN